MKPKPLTGFEQGILALALICFKRDLDDNPRVKRAVDSIAKKLGVEKVVQEGAISWDKFRTGLIEANGGEQ